MNPPRNSPSFLEAARFGSGLLISPEHKLNYSLFESFILGLYSHPG